MKCQSLVVVSLRSVFCFLQLFLQGILTCLLVGFSHVAMAQSSELQMEDEKVKVIATEFWNKINRKGLEYLTDYLTESEILRVRDIVVDIFLIEEDPVQRENTAVGLLGPWATADTPVNLPAKQLVAVFLKKIDAENKKSPLLSLFEGNPEIVGVASAKTGKYVLVQASQKISTYFTTDFVHVLSFQKEEDQWRMLLPQNLDFIFKIMRSGLLEAKKKRLKEEIKPQSSAPAGRWVKYREPEYWDRDESTTHYEVDLDSITFEGELIRYEVRDRVEYQKQNPQRERIRSVMTMQVDCQKQLRGQLPNPSMSTVFPGTDGWLEVQFACTEAAAKGQRKGR